MTLLQSRSMTRPRSSRALDERLALAGIATEVLPHRQRDRFNRTAEELMLAWGADKLSDAPESAVLVLRETIASKTHSASDVERLLPDGVCADRGGPVTFGPELDVVRTVRSAPGGPVAGQRCRARALRERSRLMHQRSMATAARRLTAVMEERAMVPEEQEPDLDSDDGFFTTARRLSAVAVDSFSAALAQLAGSMDSEECEAGRSPDWQQQPDTVPGEAHRAERSCVRPRARIRTRRSKSSSSSRSESSESSSTSLSSSSSSLPMLEDALRRANLARSSGDGSMYSAFAASHPGAARSRSPSVDSVDIAALESRHTARKDTSLLAPGTCGNSPEVRGQSLLEHGWKAFYILSESFGPSQEATVPEKIRDQALEEACEVNGDHSVG